MSESIGAILAGKAKAKRKSENQGDKDKIQAVIDELVARATVQAELGRSYIQISASITDEKNLFDAATTKHGRVYLEKQGLRLEEFKGVANIWWEDPYAIQKEAEAILNPAPIEPEPEPVDPDPKAPVEPKPIDDGVTKDPAPLKKQSVTTKK